MSCRTFSLVVLIGLVAYPVWGQTDTRLEMIETAWKKQQDSVKSLRARWTEKRIFSPGSQSAQWSVDPVSAKHNNPDNKVVPPREVTLEFPCYLAFFNNNARLDIPSPFWSRKLEKFQLIHSRQSRNERGESRKESVSTKEDGQLQVLGIIDREEPLLHLASPVIRPIAVAVRGTNRRFTSFDFATWVLTNRTAKIHDQHCLELVSSKARSPLKQILWLSPSANYSMVRHMLIQDKIVIEQTTVRPKKYEEQFWLPESWEVIMNDYSNGNHPITVYSTATEYVINPTLAPSHFQIQFQAGCQLYDCQTKKITQISGKVKEDQTFPQGEDAPQSSLRMLLSVASAIALCCAGLGIFLYRRWRANPTPRVSHTSDPLLTKKE